MFAKRDPDMQIDRYSGPYERWTFAGELGLPFAFPAIRDNVGNHFAALMEGSGMLTEGPGMEVRKPPLWGSERDITPFAVHDPEQQVIGVPNTPDRRLGKMLGDLDQDGGARFRLNMPIDEKTWAGTYHEDAAPDNWTPPAQKPKVIIGVIDDGIPFLHRAFLDSRHNSRMSLCWLQAARAPAKAAVPFGREITNWDIDVLRETYGNQELRAYRAAGAIDRDLPELGNVLHHHATHGGHIAGIAAGNDRFVGAQALPDDAQIIAVQLPNTIAWDTSGFGKEMMMLSAVEYIFNRARMLAQHYDDKTEIPLVINFSYGWSANRHDGEASFEKAVNALLERRKTKQPKTELIMPTGNNFANRMHGHFTAKDAQGGTISFGWQLKPDDRTSSYLEIWLPQALTTPDWTVTVTPPKGVADVAPQTITVDADTSLAGGDPRRFKEIERGAANIGQLSADKHQNNRWRVMLAMAPTAALGRGKQRTPVGLWTITLDTNAAPLAAGQALEVWVQRDDDPTQLGTGGQQSYLVDFARPKPPRPFEPAPLTPVRGYGCLNGIGTAPKVLRVAGYVQSTGKPASYSGSASVTEQADGTLLVGPEQPDVSAVSDQGQFRPGLPSIGVYSGSGARIVGTSAAAAAVTRMIAHNMLGGVDPRAGFVALANEANPVLRAKALSREGQARVKPVCGTCITAP